MVETLVGIVIGAVLTFGTEFARRRWTKADQREAWVREERLRLYAAVSRSGAGLQHALMASASDPARYRANAEAAFREFDWAIWEACFLASADNLDKATRAQALATALRTRFDAADWDDEGFTDVQAEELSTIAKGCGVLVGQIIATGRAEVLPPADR
jgi:hypothetical protein